MECVVGCGDMQIVCCEKFALERVLADVHRMKIETSSEISEDLQAMDIITSD